MMWMSRPIPSEGATMRATQTLLEFMRRCQREVDWERSPHRTLPAAVAGWLVAQPGEPAEVGGMRPIGQIHDELLGTIRRSGLGRLEREVLCGWYGLGRFPARLTGPGGLVGAVGGEGPPRAPGRRSEVSLHC
jgi:hypothetical protein